MSSNEFYNCYLLTTMELHFKCADYVSLRTLKIVDTLSANKQLKYIKNVLICVIMNFKIFKDTFG